MANEVLPQDGTGQHVIGILNASGETRPVSSTNPVPATGGSGASSDQVQGNAAHDAVDLGNPVKIGGKARSTLPAAVANADRVDAFFNLHGMAGAVDGGSAFTSTRTNASSADASGAVVDASAAPTSGEKIVVDDVLVSADTAMRVDFKEETSGTVIFALYLPANGAAQFTPRGRLKLPTVDKKLQVQTSAAGNLRVMTLTHSEA